MSLPTPASAGDTPAQCSELIRASDLPAKKAPSLCDEHHDMVTITMKYPAGIDREPRKYIMHKSIACYYSPVLDKALNGPFIEGQTQTFAIDDFDHPGAFGAIQSWMYTQSTDGWREGLGNRYHVRLYSTWILADRLLIPKLQNQVMVLINGTKKFLGTLISFIYRHTSCESKLREYLSDEAAALTKWTAMDKNLCLAAGTPAEFLLDILIAQSRKDPPTKQNMKAEDYFVKED